MPRHKAAVRPFNAGLADVLPPARSFNSMDFTIRRAKREDCAEMLELVRELAAFERAPDAVTVSLEHFEESGFGENPVWRAFVACAPAPEKAVEELAATAELSSSTIQDPLLRSLMPASSPPAEGMEQPVMLLQTGDSALTEPGIQLEEAIMPLVPESIQEAMPQQMAEAQLCGEVVGFALYYIRYSTWKGQRMYLEDIIVTESWRGKGVGTALMDALFGEAKVEKLHGISWQVLEWNEPAMKFYERYGVAFDREWVNVAVDV